MANEVSFLGGKAARVWGSPITSTQCRGKEWGKVYLRFPYTSSWHVQGQLYIYKKGQISSHFGERIESSAADCNLTRGCMRGLHKSIHKYPMFSILSITLCVTNIKLWHLGATVSSLFLCQYIHGHNSHRSPFPFQIYRVIINLPTYSWVAKDSKSSVTFYCVNC